MGSPEQKTFVSLQREAQYGSLLKVESLNQRADDLRRNLILKYGVSPERRALGEMPRDMWREIASDLIELTGGGSDIKGLDAGMSSGYFMKQLFEQGFLGALAGVDIVATPEHLQLISKQFEGNKVDFGQADAEKLDRAKIFRGLDQNREAKWEEVEIPDDYFDFSVSLNTYHHTDNPEEILKSLFRVTKHGGYVGVMGRAVGHFNNVYDNIAPSVAKKYKTESPTPFYEKYSFLQLDDFIENFPGFERITPHNKGLQADWLYIPANEEGWQDITNVVFSLLSEFEPLDNSHKLTEQTLRRYLKRHMKTGYFDQNVLFYPGEDQGDPNGFITEFVFQKYTICRVTKEKSDPITSDSSLTEQL